MMSSGLFRGFLWVGVLFVMVATGNGRAQGYLGLFAAEKVATQKDWLVEPTGTHARLYRDGDGHLVFANGLVARTFATDPDGATISMKRLETGEEFIRSVRPEAELVIDGRHFFVGGLTGQPIHNYLLPEWLSTMQPYPGAFHLERYELYDVKARFPWKKRLAWMPRDLPWPYPGTDLVFHYCLGDDYFKAHPGAPEYLRHVRVNIHYRLYDDIPVMCKWMTVENHSADTFIVDRFKSEILALVEGESAVGGKKQWRRPRITLEADYEFGGGMAANASEGKSVFWITDTLYLTQVNYQRKTPCLVECRPQWGPAQEVAPGDTFATFRTWELLHDSWDRERMSLERRRMYRAIAPWVTENPLEMHVRHADTRSVKKAIDQSADVGFELVVMSFGSGFNLEDTSRNNLQRMKELADYAHSKGIALGGYSLLASRHIDAENDVVMPPGMKPVFGHSPCLQSRWGIDYFHKLYRFYETTGQDVLVHDGSYPGDVCASTRHPGHSGLYDSQWKQFAEIRDFYRWCRSRGIFLRVPDWYFLNGSNKTAMGYRETNWSLPRKQQEIIERQNIYDGTWEKTPSMGWMFLPLVEYHGGGAAATIEPLKEHLHHYGQRLADLFGAGVQATFRGPQLYDAPETRALVKKWVDFYKKHREVLNADIIHLRRPDGRDYDAILHVNPFGTEKGLLMIYNPLGEDITRTLKVPLYYTGLRDEVWVSLEEGPAVKKYLDRDYTLPLEVTIPAHSQTWIVFTEKEISPYRLIEPVVSGELLESQEIGRKRRQKGN